MNQTDAERAAGLLAGSIPGFPDDALLTFTEAFETLDDAEALITVCQRISETWSGRMWPSLSEVLAEYRRHPSVVAERESRVAAAMAKTVSATHCDGTRWIPTGATTRPCPRCNPLLNDIWQDDDKRERYMAGSTISQLHEMAKDFVMPRACQVETNYDRIPSHGEGQQIMRDAYRDQYGVEMGADVVPNPGKAEEVIREGHYDGARDQWYSTYAVVLARFGGHQRSAAASLKAIGPRLTHSNTGQLTLKRVWEPPEPLWQPRTEPPDPSVAPESSEGRLDAGGTMAAALARTANVIAQESKGSQP